MACSTIVVEAMKLLENKKLSKESAKRIIEISTDITEAYDGNLNEVMSLFPDVCSVCLEKKEPEELIEWNKEDYPDNDIRKELQSRAYSNCFGDVMVGGRVCIDCARKLADIDEE